MQTETTQTALARLALALAVASLTWACGDDGDTSPGATDDVAVDTSGDTSMDDAGDTSMAPDADAGAGDDATPDAATDAAPGDDTATGSDTGADAGGTDAAPDAVDDAGGDAADNAATTEDAATSAGACDNPADLAVVEALGGIDAAGAELGCETSVCVNQNLDFFEITIDEDGVRACAANDAPQLQTLSDTCRSCYVELALCIPQECVGFFGGDNACLDIPPSDFGSCADATGETSARCAECQAETCLPQFLACAGL